MDLVPRDRTVLKVPAPTCIPGCAVRTGMIRMARVRTDPIAVIAIGVIAA